MPRKIKCSCGQVIVVSEQWIARRIRCPKCRAPLNPEASGSAPAATAAPAAPPSSESEAANAPRVESPTQLDERALELLAAEQAARHSSTAPPSPAASTPDADEVLPRPTLAPIDDSAEPARLSPPREPAVEGRSPTPPQDPLAGDKTPDRKASKPRAKKKLPGAKSESDGKRRRRKRSRKKGSRGTEAAADSERKSTSASSPPKLPKTAEKPTAQPPERPSSEVTGDGPRDERAPRPSRASAASSEAPHRGGSPRSESAANDGSPHPERKEPQEATATPATESPATESPAAEAGVVRLNLDDMNVPQVDGASSAATRPSAPSSGAADRDPDSASAAPTEPVEAGRSPTVAASPEASAEAAPRTPRSTAAEDVREQPPPAEKQAAEGRPTETPPIEPPAAEKPPPETVPTELKPAAATSVATAASATPPPRPPLPEVAQRTVVQRREGDGPAEGEPIVGVEHDAGRVSVVNYLAAAVIGLALLGVAPAIWEIVDHLGNEDSPGVAVWALGLLAIAGLQVAYAVFLMQIPDWSSVRVVALVLLAYAAGYALMLGVSAISSTGNGLVGFLQLAEYHDDGRAAGWCFIMLCSTSLLTFFAGRLAVRWKADDDEFEATLEEAP